MENRPLYILLCSGEHEKLQMAAMPASVAAVSERAVEVFVSMNAVLAFAKGAPAAERYHGGAFSKLLTEKRAPAPIACSGRDASSAVSGSGLAHDGAYRDPQAHRDRRRDRGLVERQGVGDRHPGMGEKGPPRAGGVTKEDGYWSIVVRKVK